MASIRVVCAETTCNKNINVFTHSRLMLNYTNVSEGNAAYYYYSPFAARVLCKGGSD